MKNIWLLVLASFLVSGLTGCGVKPSNVEPPSGSENKPFPRTYPDPSTDHKI